MGSFLVGFWQGERGRSTNLPSFNGSPSFGSQTCTQLTIFSSFLFGEKNNNNQVLAKVRSSLLWLNGVQLALIPIDIALIDYVADLDSNDQMNAEIER